MEKFPPKDEPTNLEKATSYAKYAAKVTGQSVAAGLSKTAAVIGDVVQVPSKGVGAFGYAPGTFYQGEGNRPEDQGPIQLPLSTLGAYQRTPEENERIATSKVNLGQEETFQAPSTPPFRIFPGYDGYLDWSDPKDVERAEQILSAGLPKQPMSQEELEHERKIERKHPGYSAGIQSKEAMIHLGLRDNLTQTMKCIEEEKAGDMKIHVQVPYNGEAPKEKLMSSVFTPNQYAYVRSHGNIPIVDADMYELEVSGLVENPRNFKLKELQEMFEHKEYTVTLQCAGNRRSGLEKTGVLTGDEIMNTDWDEQGISTAKYKCISVRDLLQVVGLRPEADEIEFIACDTVIKKTKPFNFASSVTLRKVLTGEVVLAWEMNGKPLPHIHGFPLRVLVLGYQGARSPKWIKKIVARIGPSLAPTVRKEYIWFPSSVGKHNVDYTRGMPITEWPINSSIMSPREGDVIIHHGWIEVMGWAWAGGGRWVERVEISTDDGSNWTACGDHEMSEKRYFAWRLWKTKVPVPQEGWMRLAVRAFDCAANSQPHTEREIWNWKGYLNNSQHTISVYSANATYPQTAKRLAQMKVHGDSLSPLKKTMSFEPELEDPADKFVEGRKSPLPSEA